MLGNRAAGGVQDLTQGVIWKQLAAFALPFLFSNLLQQFYSTADAAIVGQAVGAGGLAAIGSCDRLIMLLINFFLGVSTGASIAVSQAFGRHSHQELHRVVHTSVALGLLSGVALTVIGVAVSPALLRMMDTPADVFPLAVDYIQVYFFGMVPSMVYNMGSGILRAMGNSQSALFYLLAAGIINIGLDLWFVVGLGWGTAGAAGATALSQLLPAILVLRKLSQLEEGYRLQLRAVRIWREEAAYIIRVGIPAGMRMVLISLSNVIVQTRINQFGLEAMAGVTLFFRLEGYLYMTVSAVSLALTSFCGQNIGAGNLSRLRRGQWVATGMAVGVSSLMILLMLLFTQPICHIFTQDPGAVYYARLQIVYLLPLYFLFTLTEVVNGAVLSSGRSVIPMLIGLAGMCAARVGFIYVALEIRWDIRMIYLAFPFSWIVTYSLLELYYHRGHWLQGQRLRDALAAQAEKS